MRLMTSAGAAWKPLKRTTRLRVVDGAGGASVNRPMQEATPF
jgi:hypothetical protein